MIKPLVFVFLCGVISMSEVRASEQAQIRTLRERPITEAIKERRMDRFYREPSKIIIVAQAHCPPISLTIVAQAGLIVVPNQY